MMFYIQTLKMLMNVSMERILVTTVNVLTASTMRVAIHVLAGQALLGMESFSR